MPVQPNHNKNLEKAFDACVNAINGLNNRQDLQNTKFITQKLTILLNDLNHAYENCIDLSIKNTFNIYRLNEYMNDELRHHVPTDLIPISLQQATQQLDKLCNRTRWRAIKNITLGLSRNPNLSDNNQSNKARIKDDLQQFFNVNNNRFNIKDFEDKRKIYVDGKASFSQSKHYHTTLERFMVAYNNSNNKSQDLKGISSPLRQILNDTL